MQLGPAASAQRLVALNRAFAVGQTKLQRMDGSHKYMYEHRKCPHPCAASPQHPQQQDREPRCSRASSFSPPAHERQTVLSVSRWGTSEALASSRHAGGVGGGSKCDITSCIQKTPPPFEHQPVSLTHHTCSHSDKGSSNGEHLVGVLQVASAASTRRCCWSRASPPSAAPPLHGSWWWATTR